MRIMILGGDGYLGWPTAMYFSQLGHDVLVVDNLAKRQWEAEVDGAPLEPVPTLRHRVRVWNDVTGNEIGVAIGDIAENHRFVYRVFGEFQPDAIVHYAEQPSAPYSMAETTIRLRPREEWPKITRTRWYSRWAPSPVRRVLGVLWPDQTPRTTSELVDELDRAVRLPGWTSAWTALAAANDSEPSSVTNALRSRPAVTRSAASSVSVARTLNRSAR